MAKLDLRTNRFSGKIGDKVYYNLKGRTIVRKKPSPRKTAPSSLEMQSRSKFAFITKFLLPLKSLFDESFASMDMTGLNRAISVNFNHVIPDSYPNWQIDFTRLSVGKGAVGVPRNILMCDHEDGNLIIYWNIKPYPPRSNARDRVYVVIYCEDLNQWQIHMGSAYRQDGSFILLAGLFSGCTVHVYVGFISDFWRGGSDSQYLGKVEIF